MHREGRGVSKNYKEALKWYRLSAAQGNADAQTALQLPEMIEIVQIK